MSLLALAVAASAALAGPAAATDVVPIGRSVEGRRLVARRHPGSEAARRVLVVGAIHGDEPAGRAVVDALRRRRTPAGVELWSIRDLNPDGSRRGVRQNARGVDLNRNFPHRWRAAPRSRYWPGPARASEPETRWAMDALRRVDPDVTVWLHQPYGFVVPADGADLTLVRRYARAARMPVRRLPRYRGTAAGWQNARLGGGGAFVVELPAGQPTARQIARQVLAIHRVAAPR